METSLPSTTGSSAGSHIGNAVDATGGSQGDSQCSYSTFVKDKFHEYIAIVEMIYVLSTDENARKALFEGISTSAVGHIVRGQVAVDQIRTYQQLTALNNILNWFGLGDDEANPRYSEQINLHAKQAVQDYSVAASKIEGYFKDLWQEIKVRYYECGWFYAVSTTATDAGFAVIEVAIGAKLASTALRSFRFIVQALPDGKVKVTVQHKFSDRKFERSWAKDDLEAKYGKPEDNHAGGLLPENNRKIPDQPAEEVGRKKPESEADASKESEDKSKALAPKAKKKIITRGSNTNEIEYDAKTGRPTRAKGVLKEDFGSTKRGDNATQIGKRGDPGDQGGHLVGHRFMGDTPDEGIVPQAGNLNQGAWKTMENEWADWIKKGYQVEYDIKVIPPGAVRPDKFDVKYKIVDPKTGKLKGRRKHIFRNQKGEKFHRVPFRDME